MEKVERYIYAVTRMLPEEQRADIEKELRSLIEDMLSDRSVDREVADQDIEAVLIELGDPAGLAQQYRTKKRYLIGPENYDTYFFVLKIVIAAVAFGITLAMVIGYFITPPQSIVEVVGDYFGGLISALFQGFAWVTIIFGIFEYFDVAIGKEFKEKKWSPAELPSLPVKEKIIKPSEAIFGIVIAVLAVILFNTADHLIAIYIISDEAPTQVIPIFNQVTFRSVLFLLNIMLAIGITKELIKLAVGKWTRSLAVINLFANLISFSLFVLFINTAGLWNDEFFSYWVNAGFVPVDTDPVTLWNRVITGLIIVVGFGMLLDSVLNLVKGLK